MLEQVKKMIAMHKDGVKITSGEWERLEALSEDGNVLTVALMNK